MTRKLNREQLLEELRTVLDVAGARPDRWSEKQRARLKGFIESDAKAAELFACARAFEQVLSQAPGTGGGNSLAKLEARIVAAVNVVAQPPHDYGYHRPRHDIGGLGRRSKWQAAALLAGSLVIGVAIGLSGKAAPIIATLGLVAGSDAEATAGIAGALFEAGSEREQERL